MSFRDAVERRIFGKKSKQAPVTRGRSTDRQAHVGTGRAEGTMKLNPNMRLDTSQIEDRRQAQLSPGQNQAKRGREHGPTTGTIPENQRGDWNTAVSRQAIQRRQTRRR